MTNNIKSVDILLVEDNHADVVLVKHTLKSMNVLNNITVAEDGEKALQMLDQEDQANLPDLIVLDLNLPKIEGREVLKTIKNTKHLKDIPVVIMSGSVAEKDRQEALDMEASAYIVKPLNLEKLIEISTSIKPFSICLVKT